MKRERVALFAWFALLGTVALFAPSFYRPENLRDLLLSSVPVLITATGMTMVILAGQIDISVGSQFAVLSVASGLLAAAGVPMPVTVALACAAGTAIGVVNGLLVTVLGAPAIVATLAMMVALREALRWWTGGAWVRNLPAGFQWFGWGQRAGQLAIPAAALAVFCLFAWCLRNLAAGRYVYAAGTDPEAARLAGINPRRVLFGVFALMGAMAGLAAVLNSVRFADVQSNSGSGLELKAIAAVVVGGAAVQGGRGSLWGTLAGVALLSSIGPALTFLGITPFWEKAIQGAIILASVGLDSLAGRFGNGR
ncbi:MAG: ABC transporter permease [Acidobacteriota bacterium]|nr:ABC transporter permease [Acidobacteriota bacterium]